MEETDILIIGSGIAGLSLAARLSKQFPAMEITLITKQDTLDSNTNHAQGGIAVVLDQVNDSFDKHIGDTLRTGDGLCDPVVVESVIREGPEVLKELLEIGIQFDLDDSGEIALAREGGHTARRIVHSKDVTGKHLAEGLLRHVSQLKNVRLLPYHLAIDLIILPKQFPGENAKCIGAYVSSVGTGIVTTLTSRVTVLATGGVGQIYKTTTNPLIATGDGIAMAHRAGARIRDMEFIQFHPTALYDDTENPAFLISETVRGFGAHLRSRVGERFLFSYDKRGELAPRDVVSKAIFNVLSRDGEGSVRLDCRHLPAAELIQHFPNIYQHCLEKGFDLSVDTVPVAPAAHYLCGGIVVDLNGETSVQNLFACGECSSTGLHGANRLASNSLLEALAYAKWITVQLAKVLHNIRKPFTSPSFEICAKAPDEAWIQERRLFVQTLMSRHAGIVRCSASLRDAKEHLDRLAYTLEGLVRNCTSCVSLFELRNIVEVSRLILAHSIERKENRGTYFNKDLQ